MEIEFKPIEEQDLPAIKEIYDWYIENSTATFHTEPIGIDQLKEFLYLDHPLYNSYLIYGIVGAGSYCFITNYKKRQAYDRAPAEALTYLKDEYATRDREEVALQLSGQEQKKTD